MSDIPGDRPAAERAAVPGTIAEYELRRCVVCDGRYPPFGFGPPLTRPGAEIWACGQHRSLIEARFAKPEAYAEPAARQNTLFDP
jgi:hypothetical protein